MRLQLFALALLATSSPVLADDTPPDTTRDTVTVAVGPAVIPRYEGSGDYRLSPAGAVRGRVKGVTFLTLGTGLFVDLVPSPAGPATKFVIGPVVHVYTNRSSLKQVRDPRIVALGKIPVSVDVGGHIGISRTGVITSDYDVASLDVAVTHDVTSVHDSLLVTPSVNYGTPLSRKAFVGVSASATYVGGGFARRYFGVTPAQASASGLPTYKPRDGFKDVTFAGLGSAALSGDLLHGLSAFATASYSRLLGDFGRSPVVHDRNQWFGGVGLAYTF